MELELHLSFQGVSLMICWLQILEWTLQQKDFRLQQMGSPKFLTYLIGKHYLFVGHEKSREEIKSGLEVNSRLSWPCRMKVRGLGSVNIKLLQKPYKVDVPICILILKVPWVSLLQHRKWGCGYIHNCQSWWRWVYCWGFRYTFMSCSSSLASMQLGR